MRIQVYAIISHETNSNVLQIYCALTVGCTCMLTRNDFEFICKPALLVPPLETLLL